ncbi:MAG: hypothetical protein ACKOPQ_16210 [Novosphingobium sp.]
MNRVLKCIAAGLLMLSPVHGTPAFAQDSGTIDALSDQVFAKLKAGNAKALITESIGKSPLLSNNSAGAQALEAQIDTALKIYGRVSAYELVKEDKIGTLFIRRYYVVQHENLVTRWELNLAKLPSGWAVVYIGFDDQGRTW